MPAATAPLSDDILEVLGRFKEAARAVNDELRGMERQRKRVEKAGRDVGPEYMQRESQLQERRDYLLKKHDANEANKQQQEQNDHSLVNKIFQKIPGAGLITQEVLRQTKFAGGALTNYAVGVTAAIKAHETAGSYLTGEKTVSMKGAWWEAERMGHTLARADIRAGQWIEKTLAGDRWSHLRSQLLPTAAQRAVGLARAKGLASGAATAGRALSGMTFGTVLKLSGPGVVLYGAYKLAQESFDRQEAMGRQQSSMYAALNKFENEQRWQSTFSAMEHKQIRTSVIEASAIVARPQGIWESTWTTLTGGESAEALERRSKAEKISMQMAMIQKTTGYRPMTAQEAMGQAEVYKNYEGYTSAPTWKFFVPTLLLGEHTKSEGGWLGWAYYKARDILTGGKYKDRAMEEEARVYQLRTLQATVQALEDHAKTITENPAYRTTQFGWANYLSGMEQDRFLRVQNWNQY